MLRQTNKNRFSGIAAQRKLKRSEGLEEITVTFGIPKKIALARWECRLEIRGLEKTHIHGVRGADSLQALLLAVEEARNKLEENGGRFIWIDIEPDLRSGIPRFVPIGFGPRFERRVELAIERESTRVWKARLKSRKADVNACQRELQERAKVLAGMQNSLERRKTVLADWEKNLRNRDAAQRRSK